MKKPPLGGYLVAKVHHETGKVFAQKLKKSQLAGLDSSAANVIFTLWQNDGASIKEIAELTGFSKSTLTCILDRLEKAGWIKRSHSKADRRVVTIHLQKSTRDIEAAFGMIIKELCSIFYFGFLESEIVTFESMLMRILKNFEVDASDGIAVESLDACNYS